MNIIYPIIIVVIACCVLGDGKMLKSLKSEDIVLITLGIWLFIITMNKQGFIDISPDSEILTSKSDQQESAALYSQYLQGDIITQAVPGSCSDSTKPDQASCTGSEVRWTPPGPLPHDAGKEPKGRLYWRNPSALVIEPNPFSTGDYDRSGGELTGVLEDSVGDPDDVTGKAGEVTLWWGWWTWVAGVVLVVLFGVILSTTKTGWSKDVDDAAEAGWLRTRLRIGGPIGGVLTILLGVMLFLHISEDLGLLDVAKTCKNNVMCINVRNGTVINYDGPCETETNDNITHINCLARIPSKTTTTTKMKMSGNYIDVTGLATMGDSCVPKNNYHDLPAGHPGIEAQRQACAEALSADKDNCVVGEASKEGVKVGTCSAAPKHKADRPGVTLGDQRRLDARCSIMDGHEKDCKDYGRCVANRSRVDIPDNEAPLGHGYYGNPGHVNEGGHQVGRDLVSCSSYWNSPHICEGIKTTATDPEGSTGELNKACEYITDEWSEDPDGEPTGPQLCKWTPPSSDKTTSDPEKGLCKKTSGTVYDEISHTSNVKSALKDPEIKLSDLNDARQWIDSRLQILPSIADETFEDALVQAGYGPGAAADVSINLKKGFDKPELLMHQYAFLSELQFNPKVQPSLSDEDVDVGRQACTEDGLKLCPLPLDSCVGNAPRVDRVVDDHGVEHSLNVNEPVCADGTYPPDHGGLCGNGALPLTCADNTEVRGGFCVETCQQCEGYPYNPTSSSADGAICVSINNTQQIGDITPTTFACDDNIMSYQNVICGEDETNVGRSKFWGTPGITNYTIDPNDANDPTCTGNLLVANRNGDTDCSKIFAAGSSQTRESCTEIGDECIYAPDFSTVTARLENGVPITTQGQLKDYCCEQTSSGGGH